MVEAQHEVGDGGEEERLRQVVGHLNEALRRRKGQLAVHSGRPLSVHHLCSPHTASSHASGSWMTCHTCLPCCSIQKTGIMAKDKEEFPCILSTYTPYQCCSQAHGLQPGYQSKVQIWLCQDWIGQRAHHSQRKGTESTHRAQLRQQAGWCAS